MKALFLYIAFLFCSQCEARQYRWVRTATDVVESDSVKAIIDLYINSKKVPISSDSFILELRGNNSSNNGFVIRKDSLYLPKSDTFSIWFVYRGEDQFNFRLEECRHRSIHRMRIHFYSKERIPDYIIGLNGGKPPKHLRSMRDITVATISMDDYNVEEVGCYTRIVKGRNRHGRASARRFLDWAKRNRFY